MAKIKNNVFIVIPIYNSKLSHVNELLYSLKGQITREDRIVWVDDGSTNLLPYYWLNEVLKYDKRHSFIRFSNNKGVAFALNAGINLASKNSYIVTMGSDDVFMPDYISQARMILDECPTIDIVVPALEFFGNQSGTVHPLPVKLNLLSFYRNNKVLAASLFRKRLWEKLGGFDYKIGKSYEDWDFWFRAACNDAAFYKLEKIGYKYRIHDNNLTNKINERKVKKKLWIKWIIPLIKALILSENRNKFKVNIIQHKDLNNKLRLVRND